MIVFVYSILVPSVDTNSLEHGTQNYLLATDEMNKYEIPFEKENISTNLRAIVKCCHEKTFETRRINYAGLKDCKLFYELYQTEYDCIYQCIGFGSCVKKCSQNAIKIINNTAVIQEGCIGCGECLESCPKGIIQLIEKTKIANEINCSAKTNETTCSAYNLQKKVEIPKRKIFKLWYICYNIFFRKTR